MLNNETLYRRPVRPLKWHGGKSYDVAWIIEKMPPHLIYIEPFFGGGQVLFARDPERDWLAGHPEAHYQKNGDLYAKHRGCSEIVNDIYEELINFWTVLQDPVLFQEFNRRVVLTPFAEVEFALSQIPGTESAERAADFFLRNRLSRQGLGKNFATMVRARTRRKMSDPVSAYLAAVDDLPAVHERLRRVVVLNEEATAVIQREDNSLTLFYCDPPYPSGIRTSKEVYDHEMTDQQHSDLLDVLQSCKGDVMLSLYPNTLYDERLKNWNHHDRTRDNKASSARSKQANLKTERLWMNF